MNEFLLKLHVETFVPLAMEEYRLFGGPSEEDYARVRNIYPTEIGSHGDAILYKEKGQTARMMNMLVDGLAVLAFCPSGVTLFGHHFEALPLKGEEHASLSTQAPQEATATHSTSPLQPAPTLATSEEEQP